MVFTACLCSDVSAAVSLTGSTLRLSGGHLPEDYVFEQLHFHWGEDADEGSEHFIDGNAFPMEVDTLDAARAHCLLQALFG